jgi:hypothetical protein
VQAGRDVQPGLQGLNRFLDKVVAEDAARVGAAQDQRPRAAFNGFGEGHPGQAKID